MPTTPSPSGAKARLTSLRALSPSESNFLWIDSMSCGTPSNRETRAMDASERAWSTTESPMNASAVFLNDESSFLDPIAASPVIRCHISRTR